jgi:alkylation response protein AidB-like acyl-CoA dehydrogenase
VRLDLSADQEFLRDTTDKFLLNTVPVDELRRLHPNPTGYASQYWRRGAELGWTSLLVAEEHGGGTISGQGLLDLTLIAYEFGRRAAPGPLLPTNIVASAVSALGSGDQTDLLPGLLSGVSVASWCFQEPGPNGHDPRNQHSTIRVDGSDVVIDGVKRPVESADQADYLLVTGQTDGGLTQVLVPRDTPGVSLQPMSTVDLTRRFWTVTFDSVRLAATDVLGAIGTARAQVERQLQQALVILTAETVGVLQTAFEMTLEWAFDRYSFGRPLASYQELKHRFADMKSWLEASHAIADAAAVAVADGSTDAKELTSVAKAFTGDYGSDLVHDCVQIHGGIGVTFDHDLHMFVRRQVLNRALFGTPADHRQLIAGILQEAEAA